MVQLYINGTDRTSAIVGKSVNIRDHLNEFVNTLRFDVRVHDGQTYKPNAGDEVVFGDGTWNSTTKTFSTSKDVSGSINRIIRPQDDLIQSGPTSGIDFGQFFTR